MKVLIVEDEGTIQTLIKALVEKNGHTASAANTVASAQEILDKERFNAIILDLGLPDGNGFDLCKSAREKDITAPILILSGESDTDVKIKCLNAGADDYLTKPFDSSELIARLDAVTRRSTGRGNKSVISSGGLKLNKINRVLTVNGEDIRLTNNELDLLSYLMEREGTVISQDEISKNIWGIDFHTPSNFVNVYISYLRKKIREHSNHEYIKTIRSEGFIFANHNPE